MYKFLAGPNLNENKELPRFGLYIPHMYLAADVNSKGLKVNLFVLKIER